MKLYHASAVIVKQPNVCYAREHLDFGKGFYLTSLYEQAQNYAMRFLLRHSQAYINTYLLDEGLNDYKWKILAILDYVHKNGKYPVGTQVKLLIPLIINNVRNEYTFTYDVIWKYKNPEIRSKYLNDR